MTDQTVINGEPKPKRSHKGPKTKIGRPLRMVHTTKKSHTSPKKVYRRKRIKEALGYRLQGYTFEQIAGHMKCSMSVAHGYVVEGMNAIPLENAKQLMRIELERLDLIQSAFFANATEGDLHAAAMCLKVADQRARLLGLYPKENGPSLLISAANGEGGGPLPPIMVTFHMPQGSKDSPDSRYDGPRHGQRLLPPPREMERDPVTGTWFEPKDRL
jgi:hypothetical protein